MKSLPTRTRRASFRYGRRADGSIRIAYGGGFSATITTEQFNALLRQFRGRTVPLGTSRDTARLESVGFWLQQNVSKTALASYVGPILVHEGLASWGERDLICFKE